jgi:hypothetical protein
VISTWLECVWPAALETAKQPFRSKTWAAAMYVMRSAARVPDVTSMGDQLIDIAKAEVRAWRWEWGPVLLFAFILADGVAGWDPLFAVPWLLVAAVLFFVARGARRGQSNGARAGRNSG